MSKVWFECKSYDLGLTERYINVDRITENENIVNNANFNVLNQGLYKNLKVLSVAIWHHWSGRVNQ